jgi:recombinational DNA repair protein (RecF pathway)
MRTLILALTLALAAPALAQTGVTPSYTEDARTHASDEDIRIARRAYRAACQQLQSDDYCECMTGGMAQSLPPIDLRTATALLPHNLAGAVIPEGLNQSSIDAAQAASADYEPLCRPYRR